MQQVSLLPGLFVSGLVMFSEGKTLLLSLLLIPLYNARDSAFGDHNGENNQKGKSL